MKTHYLFLVILFYVSIENNFAQAPPAIPYQAVARDNSGNLLANQNISLRLSIRDVSATGIIVYSENHLETTNEFGLFTLNIGHGTVLSGVYSAIAWGEGAKFVQIELDSAGGTSYINMGTQQMLSVPYAINAANGNWNKNGNDIYNSNNGNVGIGVGIPATSAKLEVASTTKGFLPPRMTYAQRNAISNPVVGLIICCTNCASTAEIQMFNGNNWTNMVGDATSTAGVLTLCDQTWMLKNLEVSRYRNGDIIPKVTDPVEWAALTTGAYCYYNNDSATYAAIYGRLYNYYAVVDSRGLAPEGWHIPSDAEWTALETCLGGASVAGGAMKETGTTHWSSPNTGATNSSGFTALPGGNRNVNGLFLSLGDVSYWWSTTVFNTTDASFKYITFNNNSLQNTNSFKVNGFSIRCIRD
jgi:uncharacterized protein (TIGR02145 family)